MDDGEDSSASKRPRIDAATGLMSENDYASTVSFPITLQFSLPTDGGTSTWNLDGSTKAIVLSDVMISVKDLKAKLATEHCGGMPVSKFQVKSASLGFLKDRLSVAHYNLKDGEVIEVSLKTRGKR